MDGKDMVQDPTELERLRAAIQISDRYYQQFVEGLDAIVYAADAPMRRFSFVSRRAEKILGYPPERWLHEPDFWVERILPADREPALSSSLAAFAGEQDHLLEYRVQAADARVVWVRDSSRLLRDAKGRVCRILGLMVDITEQKRVEGDLRGLTAQLQAVARALTAQMQEGDWRRAGGELVQEALRATGSTAGFVGAVVDGAVLRVVAWEGLPLSFPATPTRTAHRRGGESEPQTVDFGIGDDVLGRAIRSGRSLVANEPAVGAGVADLPAGFPPLAGLLGLPIVQGIEVVGLLAVANRPGGYAEGDEPALDLLARTAGVLLDNFRRMEHERELEARLRQSQKMESLGLLAGGVAHDFNNHLTAIIGFADVLAAKLAPDSPLCQYVRPIRSSGVSAAQLTRQLLAFSRRQVLTPGILDLGDVIAGMELLLRRTIGENIALEIVRPPDLAPVKADCTQIEQVVLNLAVNARDAMATGGVLTIETANLEVDAATAGRNQAARCGPHVMLAVSDTGCGMDQATRARLFEPFFTTKELGKGTGLGLATVYGIVKQSEGFISVYSEPGKGTTFKIYLPCVTRGPEAAAEAGPAAQVRGGSETVMVVDDAQMVLSLVSEILAGHGYRVLEAHDPAEAIRVSQEYGGTIHLLMTDMVMPGMDGVELARRLKTARPDLRTVFMSGYTDPALVNQGMDTGRQCFLQKPLSLRAIALAVRAVLDGTDAEA